MKKTLVLVSLLFLIVPFAASAHRSHHHILPAPSVPVVSTSQESIVSTISTSNKPATKPAPVPPPVPVPVAATAPTGLCMNYGYQQTVNGQYDFVQVDTDLAVLKKAGILCLRLEYNGFNSPATEALALHAKAQGFSILTGGDWGVLDPSQLASYDARVLTQAQWEQQNAIPQMSLGNEQETRLSGMSLCQWQNHLQTLAAQVHQVYSGKVSYDIDGEYVSQYIACGGLGGLDAYGLNLYAGEEFNAKTIQSVITAFGPGHVYVGEINCDISVPATGCSNDATHAAELQSDLLVLQKTFNIPLYYFNFSFGAAGQSQWGLYNGTTLQQPLTAAVLGIK